jgi:hypothetical protein
MKSLKLLALLTLSIVIIITKVLAEPIVVLSYRGQMDDMQETVTNNVFATDPDYSTTYKIAKGEALGQIIKRFYNGSGLDHRFVKLAIVTANPSAFAQENPNFMFAGVTLHIPSINQIQNLVLGKRIKKSENYSSRPNRHIFFFGG